MLVNYEIASGYGKCDIVELLPDLYYLGKTEKGYIKIGKNSFKGDFDVNKLPQKPITSVRYLD